MAGDSENRAQVVNRLRYYITACQTCKPVSFLPFFYHICYDGKVIDFVTIQQPMNKEWIKDEMSAFRTNPGLIHGTDKARGIFVRGAGG